MNTLETNIKILRLYFKLVSRVKFINLNKLIKNIDEEINQYQEGAKFIKENKMVIVKVILTTFAQICFNYSITFFVYKAFNLSTYSFLTVFSYPEGCLWTACPDFLLWFFRPERYLISI